MPRALTAARMLARRARARPPPPRRHLQGPSDSDSIASKIANLSEAERAELSKELDKMGAELQSKLVQEVDAYLQRPTFSNDKGNVNRVLNFFKVPKGERREKLIWRSSLAIFFTTSLAVGQWEARRCMQHFGYMEKQDEETANHAA
ncbi:hypothetical protein ACP70R_014640 [Stipagrostis hirtigluma subsp. patula]